MDHLDNRIIAEKAIEKTRLNPKFIVAQLKEQGD